MILSYATSLVAIAATAICFIIITLMYWRSPSGPLTFKRRVIIADYCLLLLYLCCHFFRSRNDETEILCVPSILSLYLLWESFLITCTTFSNGKIYANKYALDKTVQEWMRNVNPWALQRITEILLEASQSGYWDASPEMLQDLQSLFISMEGVIEGR